MGNAASLTKIPVEWILTGTLFLLMFLAALPSTRKKGVLATVTSLGLVLAAVFAIKHLASHFNAVLFYGMLRVDSLSATFELLFAVAGIFSVIFLYDSLEIHPKDFGEAMILLTGSILGMSFMTSANDIIMMYLSMEFVALTSYMLAGFSRKDPKSSEAALKYAIYGGAASGVMLFGLSLLFGFAGSTSFDAIAASIRTSSNNLALILLALVMVFVGLGYKVASVPYHQWCPDVYQGSPTPITAFFSVVPKAAGFALMLRFLVVLFKGADLPDLDMTLTYLIGIISMATMTYGNLAALEQKSVKRLLAYSSIAHAGYALMGVTTLYWVMDPAHPYMMGFKAVYFYMVAYMFMNLGAFYVVALIMDRIGSDTIEDYIGLGRRNPALAVLMTIFLFSLAGIPPTIGFIGKFYLFAAILRISHWFFYLLAFVGVINSFISLFYYARIMKNMFLIKSEGGKPITVGSLSIAVLVILAIPTILFGIYFAPLLSLSNLMF